MKRTLSFVTLLIALMLAAAACGSSSETKSSSGPDFNAADVTFAQSMIPHHAQAIEMAKLAPTRAASAQVKELAAKIEGAQGPEITTMTGWLKDWGKKVPDTSMNGMDGMEGMDSGAMPGMMTSTDMKKLKDATGADFDRMFLTMMISHHEGAIDMAKTEQTDGKNSDAVSLAKKVETDQAGEITEMRTILSS